MVCSLRVRLVSGVVSYLEIYISLPALSWLIYRFSNPPFFFLFCGYYPLWSHSYPSVIDVVVSSRRRIN